MPDAPLREIVHGGLTLTQFAELSALARLASPSFEDALDARGLDEGGWNAARAAWNRAIEADLERADDGLVVAFADALAEAKERLRRGPLDPAAARPDRDSAAPPASAPEPEPEPIELAPIQSAPPNPAFVPALAHAPAISSAEPEKQRLDVTAKLPLQSILSRILPFQPAPAAPAPAASGSPGAPGSPASPAASASSSAAAPAEPAKLQPVSSSLGGTAELVIPRVLPKPLPFAPRDSAPEIAAAAPPAVAPPAPAGPRSAAASDAPPPAAGSTPRLTPEQYASLTAELAVRPDRSADVRARYFVAQEPAWSALQSEWQQRMKADPRLRQRITELVAHYRTWFERAGGGSSDR